ncbi:MAG: NADH-quinone oxidoreductase subunit H [archaeon GB-1867-035]|nr:NADH-quinone oxidoreductase subunit H [Candidatus Culexmicrobium profundum]
MMNVLYYLFRVLIYPGFLFISALAFVFEWIDRKAHAHFQNRIGPLYAGPHGFLQPLADFIKLMAKEDFTPTWANPVFFNITPVLAATLPVFASFYIPFTGMPVLPPFEGDLVLVLTLTTFFTITAFLAGWFSSNRFSSVGAIRVVLQFLGYEIPMFISLGSAAIAAGSLSITKIANSQVIPFAILQPLGFAIYIIALQAELEKIPFDIPEAESEIVAGWLTEFAGRKLAFFRLSEDLRLVLGAGLATAVFLGGGSGAILPPIVWFLIKMVIVVLIATSLRTVFARLKIDQVVRGAWKYLLPLALLQLLITKILLVVM